MTQTSPDPAVQWAEHLARLDDPLRDAAVSALRRSASTGRPTSREAVELLVGYALGEITAQQYAAGIVRSWRGDTPAPAPAAAPPEPPRPPAPSDPPAAPVGREEAVQAYVAGRIDVGEFLRITRG
ncbi:MAG: hypothetical protein ABWZ87_00730 [Aeromicrobium sp.]